MTPDNYVTQITASLIRGGGPATKALAIQALEAGLAPETILQSALIPGMTEVGRRMNCGEYYVPEVLIAARTMRMVLDVLKPLLIAAEVPAAGTAVIGTVKGDLHDIGKNLVAMMLEGAGFTVIDLGVDVSAETFVAAAREHRAGLVAISAMLTTTMGEMREVVEALRAGALTAKIMIGGAPITQAYAEQIGADGYAADAGGAAVLAYQLAHAV